MNKILGFSLITVGVLLFPTAFIALLFMLVSGVYDLYLMFVNQSLTFEGLLWALGLIFLREFVAGIILLIGGLLFISGVHISQK